MQHLTLREWLSFWARSVPKGIKLIGVTPASLTFQSCRMHEMRFWKELDIIQAWLSSKYNHSLRIRYTNLDQSPTLHWQFTIRKQDLGKRIPWRLLKLMPSGE